MPMRDRKEEKNVNEYLWSSSYLHHHFRKRFFKSFSFVVFLLSIAFMTLDSRVSIIKLMYIMCCKSLITSMSEKNWTKQKKKNYEEEKKNSHANAVCSCKWSVIIIYRHRNGIRTTWLLIIELNFTIVEFNVLLRYFSFCGVQNNFIIIIIGELVDAFD